MTKHKLLKVVDMMVQHHKDEDVPRHRRFAAHARLAVMENRVTLNGRKVTHTETSVPCGVHYTVEINDLNTGIQDRYEVQT